MRKRALIVEDHEEMRELIKTALPDFAFSSSATFRDAITLLEHNQFELVILDLALADSNPEATVAHLAGFMALAGNAAVLVMTGHPSALDGRVIPADALLRKPFTIAQLDAAVAEAIATNSPASPRPVTSLLLAATRAALGPAALALRHATA